ncbi:hypothetical protein HA402_010718 [Bradysia odoriphaga]|nr:hypothetical protein HA402_010718 [Bradysia odoriphaga]
MTLRNKSESNVLSRKRKLVESRDDTKLGSITVSNHTLDTFLDARKHIKTVRDKSTAQPVKISSNEEVWIFQCPKNIETEDLLVAKLFYLNRCRLSNRNEETRSSNVN